jgi:hypothetical protein
MRDKDTGEESGASSPLLTVSISPRHLAHSMDKRTRANANGDSEDL